MNFPYGILGNPPKFSYAPAPNTVETWYNEPLYNKLISITKGRYKEKKLDYNGKHILPVPWGIILSHFFVCGSISQTPLLTCPPPVLHSLLCSQVTFFTSSNMLYIHSECPWNQLHFARPCSLKHSQCYNLIIVNQAEIIPKNSENKPLHTYKPL